MIEPTNANATLLDLTVKIPVGFDTLSNALWGLDTKKLADLPLPDFIVVYKYTLAANTMFRQRITTPAYAKKYWVLHQVGGGDAYNAVVAEYNRRNLQFSVFVEPKPSVQLVKNEQAKIAVARVRAIRKLNLMRGNLNRYRTNEDEP